MSTSSFVNNYRFGGNTDYVYDRCSERRISFRTEFGIGKKEIYKEWTLICQTKNMKEHIFTFFYLSRAYVPHSVFVYTTAGSLSGQLYPEIMAIDVREVVDDYVPSNEEVGSAIST